MPRMRHGLQKEQKKRVRGLKKSDARYIISLEKLSEVRYEIDSLPRRSYARVNA